MENYAKYGWVITFLVGEHVNIVGPANIDPALHSSLIANGGEEFRVIAEEGGNLTHGRIIGDYDGFEPMSDYLIPSYGLTQIEYVNPKTHVWELL